MLRDTLPRVLGYRFDLPTERLTAEFQPDHRYFLSTKDIPMNTESAPVIGESVMISVEEAKHRRVQEVDRGHYTQYPFAHWFPPRQEES